MLFKCRGPRFGAGVVVWFVVRRFPTLPHPVECSTIGAGRLSFRVRDGAGRFPAAMTAATFFGLCAVYWWLVGSFLYSGCEYLDTEFMSCSCLRVWCVFVLLFLAD